MKLITNSMHWGWKVSFAVCAFIAAASIIDGGFGGGYVEEDVVIIGLIPTAFWLTARWLSIGSDKREEQ